MSNISGTLTWPVVITRQMDEGSDEDLARRTAAGDRDAFAALYSRHHATIFRFARLMTGSDTMAEDVVQEVFLVLMRSADRFDATRASLPTYLYGVARHYTRRRLLRERRFLPIDESSAEACVAEADTAADVERRSEVQRLRRAILALPSRYREVVVLCDLHEVSYADAASAIGCAIGTVRSRLHRARPHQASKMQPACGNEGMSGTTMRCTV
jgi:RNA polymerase sigma-70 factor (ECF subfamily)